MIKVICAAALFVALGWLPVNAQTGVSCTDGTQQADRMIGTSGRDTLCALGGEDYVNGKNSADVVSGGRANDTVVGGYGPDRIYGRYGDDNLFATDGDSDVVNGGPGRDNCYGDREDRFVDCEHQVKV